MLQSSLYVGLSGQITLQRRLDTVAQNVANSSTAGYRAENVKFGSLISNAGHVPVAYATTQSTTLSRRTGEIVSTGNPLDVAVSGDAWLSIETPAGPAYTRDGRMRMLPTGELQTLTGRPVLDDGGAALTVNPRGGPVEILELAALQRPEEGPQPDQAQAQRDRDQHRQPVHFAALARRSELPITSSELVDMATAAISGVTRPAIASGTASRL